MTEVKRGFHFSSYRQKPGEILYSLLIYPPIRGFFPMEILPDTLPGSGGCCLLPPIMAEVWGFFAMENFHPAGIRVRDLNNMPTNQGKLDNGEWRCCILLEGSGLIPLDNDRNAGKSRQWRTVPEPGLRPPAAGTDASPGLPMGNGTMEDGEVP